MRIVFMGTPDFASASLKKLIDERFDVVGVFTQPDKPKGRGMELCASPVKELALENGLPVFQPVKMRDGTALAQIKALEPDILVVVAYGRILPDDILAVPKYGAINVHGSLLPKYRGAAPIQWAVLNGDKITGVTTMYLASEMDTGDIIYTAETEIGEYETSGELFDRLKDMGAELLAEDCRADVLILLTAVDHVAINFGKPDQMELEDLTVEQAEEYLEQGQFGKGSMEPKVRAGVKFAKSRPGRACIIGSLEKAAEAVAGLSGTRIHA